jgi:hypothetical protein
MGETVDYLVSGTVITVDPERRVFLDGAVAVDDGRIVDVGRHRDVEAAYEGRKRLAGSRNIVMPGLIDTRNHMAQALVRSPALEDYPNICPQASTRRPPGQARPVEAGYRHRVVVCTSRGRRRLCATIHPRRYF